MKFMDYSHYMDKVFVLDCHNGNNHFHNVVWVTCYIPTTNAVHFRFFRTLYGGDWISSNMVIYESTKEDKSSSMIFFVDNLIRLGYNIGTNNDLEEAEYIYDKHKYNIL